MTRATNMKGSSSDGPPYDLICVGFGPASLSIAVALHDMRIKARVLFLERQTRFAWHCGMLLPDTRMQITFLKDMATFRDPRSKFTFLNYLHAKNRLVPFANLGTFYPLREEFNDYLGWCASHFDDHVQYGEEVLSVLPLPSAGAPITAWHVVSRNVATGDMAAYTAKNVVIAVGGTAKIPDQIPERLYNSKVIHSSTYSLNVTRLLHNRDAPYKIAVVGGGQSAVEIFTDLQSRFPNCKTTLFIRQAALKPSDDSPFVNEIFDPDQVEPFFSLPADVRKKQIHADHATNYSVVRIELIKHVYNMMYGQRLRDPNQRNWAHRIVPLQEVQSVLERASGKVDLKLKGTHSVNDTETITADGYDLVVFGTGYVRNAHRKMLKVGDCSVDKNYQVQFKDGVVARGVGIWLQGCCEATHGLSDSLLSILAVRGGKLVNSIFGEQEQEQEQEQE